MASRTPADCRRGSRAKGAKPSNLAKRVGNGPVSTPHTARALKAWETRRAAWYRAGQTERASKKALSDWCTQHGWKVVFFEGRSGAPRTGIVDAVLLRIAPREPDSIELRLVQLKAGAGGLTAAEVKRLKAAALQVATNWSLVAFDGEELHFVPDLADTWGRADGKARHGTGTAPNMRLQPTAPVGIVRRRG